MGWLGLKGDIAWDTAMNTIMTGWSDVDMRLGHVYVSAC